MKHSTEPNRQVLVLFQKRLVENSYLKNLAEL